MHKASTPEKGDHKLAAYTLVCSREPLSGTLGPPDYFPQTTVSAEESLSRETCQNGYREVVDGVDESKEATFSLAHQGTCWTKQNLGRYREAIHKRLRAVNVCLVRKLKIGQVYGVPLSGPLLLKPGLYPEQRLAAEDSRRKWLDDLTHTKSLRLLADHAPTGIHFQDLVELAAANPFPLVRASWCIRVIFLNHVRPTFGGLAGSDKAQSRRTELWTKEILEVADILLSAICADSGAPHTRAREAGQSSRGYQKKPLGYDSLRKLSDHVGQHGHSAMWQFVVCLVEWHCAQGLLNRATLIEFTLKQLTERESVKSLELLLPLALFLLDGVCTPQAQIHSFVRICAHWLQRIASAGSPLQSPEQPRLLYLKKSLVEVVRYFLKALPPLSTALDCFPLLKSNSSIAPTKGFFYAGILSVDPGKLDQSAKPSSLGRIACSHLENAADLEQLLVPHKLLLPEICEAVERGTSCLLRAVKPCYLEQNECRVLQGLDLAFDSGDVPGAVRLVFGETASTAPDEWVLDLYSSCPSIYCSVDPSHLSGVVSLCDWAVCDFREHRDFQVTCEGGSAVTDMSRIYLAVSALRFRANEMKEGEADSGVTNFGRAPLRQRDRSSGRLQVMSKGQPADSAAGDMAAGSKHASRKASKSMHNLIVAWLDQHETSKGSGSERLQLLIAELVRSSLFLPASYVRLLVSNGILEKTEGEADYSRSQRHRCIVKLLPMCGGLNFQRGVTRGKRGARHEKSAVSLWNEMRIALFGIGCQRKRRREQEVRGDFRRMCQSCQQDNVEALFEAQLHDKGSKRKNMSTLSGPASSSLEDLKQKICTYLRLPEVCLSWKSSRMRRRGSLKPAVPSALLGSGNRTDDVDLSGGCEGCARMKRIKTADARELDVQSSASFPIIEEDWWSKHPQKTVNTVKIEASVKQPVKQTTRGRPKIVRKTQSLAHLAATCPEDMQGTLPAHRLSKGPSYPAPACPEDNQDSNLDFTASFDFTTMPQTHDVQKGKLGTDLFALGASVKDLRLNDRWDFASWLDRAIRRSMGKKSLASSDVDGAMDGGLLMKAPTLADSSRESGWHMDEEQFKAVIYLLHMTSDLRTMLDLSLWLLPVVSLQRAMVRGVTNRNVSKGPPIKGDSIRQVGEATIMSFIRRYDTALAAMDLLPQALSTGMRCAEQMLVKIPGGKASCRAMLSHVLGLLKKYGTLSAVQTWESMWKVSGDKQVQAELDALKAADPDGNFGMLGRGSFDGDDKHDDPVYLRLTGRPAKVGAQMKESVQRLLGEAAVRLIARAKELSGPNQTRDGDRDVLDGTLQTAQRVVQGLVDAMKQCGGSAVDPSLVAAAVAAVVGNVGSAVVSAFNAFVSNQSLPGPPSGLVPYIWCARHVIQMHVYCVCYLKDVFGEHQSRLLEVALASEAGSSVLGFMNRAPRVQILSAPDSCDIPAALSNESAAASCMALLARPAIIPVASVAAFVAGAVVQGMISLERVVTLLKINEGLEALQVSFRGPVNVHGTGRASVGGNVQTKAAEANLYWFRVLVGNCRTVSAGLITALLGESHALGLAQIQRSIPLRTVLPSAYCLFSIALHKQTSYFHAVNRDDSMFQAATMAIHDVVAHQPFREMCFRDTRALYSQLSVDAEESEHAAALDNQRLDISPKLMAILPLRARLFLYAILEGKVSDCLVSNGEKPCSLGAVDHRCGRQMNVYNHTEELVKVLDNLHPATFHWQWVELRMLLNEQVILEKLESANVTAVQALQAALAAPETRQLTECEKTFTEIVLTRLLVRPDAAALYSEVLRCLGRAFEDYLILQVKWVLEGADMLFGRKSLRQVLDNYANRQGLSAGSQSTSVSRCLPFGRRGGPGAGVTFESPSRHVKAADSSFRRKDRKCDLLQRQYVIEKALAEMVLPCLVRSSTDACFGFALELAKQLGNLEQHLSMLCRTSGRPQPPSNLTESYNHKALVQQRSMSWFENGSPGVGRKSVPLNADSQPVYAAAIQASVWLRLQFLMPLLPIIQSDREHTARNIQVMLVPVLLRLLDTRVLQEPPDQTLLNQQDSSIFGADGEWVAEAATSGATATAGEWVFDRLVAVLHFISNTMPSAPSDQEVAERVQADAEQAQVSPHLLTVMRTVPLSVCKISAAPPQLPPSTSLFVQGSYLSGQATTPGSSTLFGKDASGNDADAGSMKAAPAEADIIDPWILLEDAAVGASMTAGGMASSSDALMTLKSTPWLRGAIRERRRESIYAGAVDHDS